MSHTPDTSDSDTLRTNVRSLGNLLHDTAHPNLVWSERDYGPILQHQLNARLAEDLGELYPDSDQILSKEKNSTFGDLISQPHPSVPALKLVKEFAKQLNHNAQYAYPEDVAMVLYFACIAAADLRAHVHITDLPDTEIVDGYAWAYNRPWIPEALSTLFREALTRHDRL